LIEGGEADGITALRDPILEPGGLVDKRWGGGAAPGHIAYVVTRLPSAGEIPQVVGPRLGCRVFTPAAYGVDLAALCLNGAVSVSPD
jgi:hypothetical protein